jgi:hypothetical protein
MNRQQFCTTVFLTMLALGGQCQCAHAGWFGPNNYNERVLEKLSGKTLNTRQVLILNRRVENYFHLNRTYPTKFVIYQIRYL